MARAWLWHESGQSRNAIRRVEGHLFYPVPIRPLQDTAADIKATAVAIPRNLVNLAAGSGDRNAVRLEHPSSTFKSWRRGQLQKRWVAVDKAIMNRSARVLKEGWGHIPGDAI